MSKMDSDDLVCIVGMGECSISKPKYTFEVLTAHPAACRLPGGVTSPSALWDFLMKKRSAQGPIPEMRFNKAGFYDPDGNRAGVMNSDGGYFLQEDVRNFENSFFGINNLEATSMDPQQRKLLEVVFECLENSGVPLDHISGSNTGVYIGNFTLDYLSIQSHDLDSINRYSATGTGTAILANRISHVFNLQGPRYVYFLRSSQDWSQPY